MRTAEREAAARRPMGAFALTVWALIAALAVGGFLALGQWQMQRRAWKLDLIAQVENRIHAPAVAAPTPAQWAEIIRSEQDYAYRRITLDGVWLHQYTTLVQASTVLGAGWWVMTPLRTEAVGLVWINRGFVPQSQTDGPWRIQPQARVSVTGLLRLSEPGGTFLRKNDLALGRWFSRDVVQISASYALQGVAPYFVDAQARAPLPPAALLQSAPYLSDDLLPVGGLTVVKFHNNHLVYAATWFGLALMVVVAAAYVGREEIRVRRHAR